MLRIVAKNPNLEEHIHQDIMDMENYNSTFYFMECIGFGFDGDMLAAINSDCENNNNTYIYNHYKAYDWSSFNTGDYRIKFYDWDIVKRNETEMFGVFSDHTT